MINVTKQFEFDCAHRLENYKGLCQNIHGHRYKLLVTVARKNDDVEDGFVADFKDVKKIVNEKFVNLVDHAFIFNCKDEDSLDIAKFLVTKIDQRVYRMPYKTTAENMARYIYQLLNKEFKCYDLKCTKIVLFETPTSYVKYKEE